MRLSWIDRWRGFLIISIVFFHVICVGISVGNIDTIGVLESLKSFISSYHVASFFVIAAILWKEQNISISDFVIKKSKRLLIPYAIFGIWMVVIFSLSAHFVSGIDYYSNLANNLSWYAPFLALLHGGGWPNDIGNRVIGPLWFLPCFFSSQLVFYFVSKFCNSTTSWFSAAVFFLVIRLLIVKFELGFNFLGGGMAILFIIVMCISRGILLKFNFDINNDKRLNLN